MTITPPVLHGFIGDAGTRHERVHVWCSWCCDWHTHGTHQDERRGDGHRVAHCYVASRRSPYCGTGYTIMTCREPFEEIRKSMKKMSSSQRWVAEDDRTTVAIQRLRAQPEPKGTPYRPD